MLPTRQHFPRASDPFRGDLATATQVRPAGRSKVANSGVPLDQVPVRATAHTELTLLGPGQQLGMISEVGEAEPVSLAAARTATTASTG
jgi:hypothetical protein